MALKFTINDPVEVPGNLREHYAKAEDGKFHLALDGHPDAARVAEFRSNNIALKQQLAKYEAVDLDEYAKLKAHAADPDAIVALRLELEAEKGKVASAQAKADRAVLREKLRDKLLAAGVLPAALDIALDKAEPAFTITGSEVTTRPGGPLNVDEFILSAITEFPFLFGASRGGGSIGSKPSVLGAPAHPNVLRNPSPQDLGKHSHDIKSGKMKVEYTT